MIKAIIFDYGGVLTHGRYTAAIIEIFKKRFSVSAVENYEAIDNIIRELDAAKIRPTEAVERLNRELGLSLSFEEVYSVFDEAVNPQKEVIDLIKTLREKYRVILLSNNNEITIGILRTKYKELLSLFEKTYFSSELKKTKPSKEIFQHVLKDTGLKAEECIFVDDKEKNVKAARELGFKAILFNDAKQLK